VDEMVTTAPTLLYVDGAEKKFISLTYEKSHPNPDPDTVEFRLTPEEAEGIESFDTIDIKKNGITEWYGFVEEITPEVGEDGLEYIIEGRCWKLIVWKKYTDRYQESREVGPENTEGILESGFFGSVYPDELIKFLMRAPRSIHPKNYIRHKIGWGIPSDSWDCCANVTADCYYPEWVVLRYTGLAWRNRGGIDDYVTDTLVVDGFDSTHTDWNTIGVQPWLNNDDEATNEIFSPVPASIGDKEGNFSFQNLAADRLMIAQARLYIKSSGVAVEIAVWLYDGADWHKIGYIDDHILYEYTIFNVRTILDTPTKVNAAKIMFECENITLMYSCHITYAYLEIISGYSMGAYQHKDDWFIIDMKQSYDDVTAILLECRNNPEMYARNYKIQYTGLSGAPAWISNCCCDEVTNDESYWKEFSPAVNVASNYARDILHSWEPEDDVRCIRIKLTASANQAWEISQAYIWQADEHKYRLVDEGD